MNSNVNEMNSNVNEMNSNVNEMNSNVNEMNSNVIKEAFPNCHSPYLSALKVAFRAIEEASNICEKIWAEQAQATVLKLDESPVTSNFKILQVDYLKRFCSC